MRSFGSMNERIEPRKPSIDTWIGGGGLAVAICALLMNSGWKNPWLIVFLLLYLVLFIFSVSFESLKRFFRRISSGLSWCAVRRVHGQDLRLTLESLNEALGDRGDTLKRLLVDVAGWTDLSSQQSFNPEHLETIRSWLIRLSGRFPISKGRVSLEDWVGELDTLIYQCNRFWSEKQRYYEASMRAKAWPDARSQQFKREWNQRREGWVRFIAQWEALGARINEKTGVRVCSAHFENIAMF